jgi:hypothetical protein
MLDREVTHSDLVEIAKRNGDFRKNYGLLVGAFLYLRSLNATRPRLFWWQGFMAGLASVLVFGRDKLDRQHGERNEPTSFILCRQLK